MIRYEIRPPTRKTIIVTDVMTAIFGPRVTCTSCWTKAKTVNHPCTKLSSHIIHIMLSDVLPDMSWHYKTLRLGSKDEVQQLRSPI